MIKNLFKTSLLILLIVVIFGSTFYSSIFNDSVTKWIESDPIYKMQDASLFNVKDDEWVEKTISSMTLEEKVGQLIFPYAYGRYYSEDDNEYKRLEHLVTEIKVGGFIFFNGEVYEQAILTNKLQQISKLPLLISSDFENGVAQRAKSSTYFPTNMALGATRDSLLIYKMGEIIGKESRAIGVHQNYAPVVDVNTNPSNPIINVRAFSEDKNLVSSMSNALIKGMQRWNMIATSKHFPGHGNTNIDSHSDIPVISSSIKELNETELIPFKSNFENGILSVMVGHLAIPSIDKIPDLPASLSGNIVTGLLKEKLKFNGLIVTDAMNMSAITKYYSTADAAIKAIEAGNDVLLFPKDEDEAYGALVFAVQSGQIKESRIEQSVRKILLAKRWTGIDKQRFVDINKITERVGTKEHWEVSKQLAQKSITLVRNDQKLIPIQNSHKTKYYHIALLDNNRDAVADNFGNMLKQRIPELTSTSLPLKSRRKDYIDVLKEVAKTDIIFLSTYTKVRDGRGSIGLIKNQENFVNDLLSTNKKIVFLAHGNPYILSGFPKTKTYLCNYGSSEVLENAFAEALFGEISIQGKLPISIPNTSYKYGDGIIIKKSAITDNVISKIDNDVDRFKQVDKLMQNAIRDSIFPGGVLLIAKDGNIISEQSYGHFTYNVSSKEVSPSTLYDLASLTKVIATTTAVMICIDRGLINLDDKVVKYFPQFGVNGKDKITVRNLLLHNSGFTAFRTFYKNFSKPEEVINEIFSAKLEYETGTKTVYSDFGFITLAKIIEKVSKKSFDKFCNDEIFIPLGMRDTKFSPSESEKNRIAPTELDTYWRKRLVHGTVHDENSALLNGVAGHAGLFSNAKAISFLLQMLLQKGFYQGQQFIKSETVELFTKRNSLSSSRALGWDTKTDDGTSSAGKLFSMNSFGHTGFTGTSVWIDPDRNLFVILLTNRVYPTRANTKHIKFRRILHEAVINSIEK
jgi:beta-glucosidase-like glycosyl hydrolase/CubicO group peptidase (beta-lactamase class C family)